MKIIRQARLHIKKEWLSKNLFIYLITESGQAYLYDHDVVASQILESGVAAGTKSWEKDGDFHWVKIPKNKLNILFPWKLTDKLPINIANKIPSQC